MIALMSSDRAQAAMEAACCRTAEKMRFRASITPQDVAVMMLDLVLYTKDLDGVGDTVNIFLFPDPTPADGSEAALLARRWYAILGGGAITSFADTSLLMARQKVAPIT